MFCDQLITTHGVAPNDSATVVTGPITHAPNPQQDHHDHYHDWNVPDLCQPATDLAFLLEGYIITVAYFSAPAQVIFHSKVKEESKNKAEQCNTQ